MSHDEWRGCYAQGWASGVLVPSAFSHPAKLSFGLAERIYAHAFERGWLSAGDTVLDVFGGVGGSAFHAALRGCAWVGCELEPRFVELANQNFDLWQKRYGGLPGWVRPVIHQGDSRRLRDVLRGAVAGCVTSPPFLDARTGTTASTATKGGGPCAERISSVPSGDALGTTAGNLSAMREGAAPALCVSSPPFADNGANLGDVGPTAGRRQEISVRSEKRDNAYGTTPGNLAAMPPGLAVASPPFESSTQCQDPKYQAAGDGHGTRHNDYGTTEGNVGNATGTTFWEASSVIVSEVFAVLKPGGVAIWHTGNFVRRGKEVLFGEQWLALCQQAGFVPMCHHRALKVERHGEQGLLDGGTETLETSKLSFFRRLATKRGLPAIEAEDIWCMRKP